MVINLKRIANEENIPLAELSFITNSKDALLLSEAAKQCGRKIFYALHEKLFHAYFAEGNNIGDRETLKLLATDCGVDENIIETAWSDEQFQKRLLDNFNAARKYEVQSVPSFVFGDAVLTGVVSEKDFRVAAEKVLEAA
jgi:predicted DsbA family dithiol-disulfide isomerase